MSDTAPTTSSASPSCCAAKGASCCTGNPCTCPCAARLAKVERTVCRIRLWLFVSLGVLVLLIGISIGRGGAMKEMQERAGGWRQGPRAAAPIPPGMQPPPPMQGGPMVPPGRGGMPDGPREGRGRGSRDRDD